MDSSDLGNVEWEGYVSRARGDRYVSRARGDKLAKEYYAKLHHPTFMHLYRDNNPNSSSITKYNIDVENCEVTRLSDLKISLNRDDFPGKLTFTAKTKVACDELFNKLDEYSRHGRPKPSDEELKAQEDKDELADIATRVVYRGRGGGRRKSRRRKKRSKSNKRRKNNQKTRKNKSSRRSKRRRST